MEQINNIAWENQLTTAFETAPFSVLLMGNVLAAMKPDLIKKGLRDFPVFALTGKPGSGKTTIARACIGSSTKEYVFTGRVSATKKEMSSLPNEYALLDDFAAFASQSSREKANTFLDEVVRLSYSGDMPCLVITAEEQALARITPSCRERLLEMPTDHILKDDRLTDILDYLADNKETLDKLFKEFEEWYGHISSNFEYTAALRNTRKQYAGKNSRSISLFFICHISMRIFEVFAKEKYHVAISNEKNVEYYKLLWKNRLNRSLTRESLVLKMFQALISDKALSPIRPRESQLCEAFCDGRCGYYNELQSGYCPYECPEIKAEYYYDPRDLILINPPDSAILIEKPECLFQYPRYCDLSTPLMIVRDDALLSLMNTELHRFCNEQCLRLPPFGPKELHQKLFELNMCMYNYISNKHKTYTFKYKSNTETDITVMVIRLTDQQFKELSENAKPACLRMMTPYGEYSKICQTLKDMCHTIRGMLGPN